MSKYKRILLAATKGGMSQSEIAASLHVSKRDVSAAARGNLPEPLVWELTLMRAQNETVLFSTLKASEA